MAIISKTTYSGQTDVSTLSGQVRLEEGNGRIVVQEGAHERVIIDKDGIHFKDTTGVEVMTIDGNNLLMNDGVNDRLLIGRQDGGF